MDNISHIFIDVDRTQKLRTNIVFVVVTSVALAWIFVILPDSNIFVNYFVKQQWWASVSLVLMTEMVDICLPGGSPQLYIFCYCGGFLLPLIIHGISFAAGVPNSYFITIMATPASGTLVQFAYLFDTLRRFDTNHTIETTDIASEESANDYHDLRLASSASSTVDSIRLLGGSTINDIKYESDRQQCSTTESMPPSHLSFSSSTNATKDVELTIAGRNCNIDGDRGTTASHLCDTSCRSLFNFLPRFYFKAFGHMRDPSPSTRLKQWALTFAFGMMLWVYYMFVNLFTGAFLMFGGHMLLQFFSFIGYIVVTTGLRMLLKRAGLALDNRKRGTVSMFFLGEVIGLTFYYSFYRVLFDGVREWREFAVLQTLHLASEWILYPVRGSRVFHDWVTSLDKSCTQRSIRALFSVDGLSFTDWQSFLCLDYGMRCLTMVITIVALLVILATIDNFPWIHNNLRRSDGDLMLTTEFMVASLATEILNAKLLHILYFKPNHLHPINCLRHAFTNRRCALVSTVTIAAIYINLVNAFKLSMSS